MPIRIPLLGLQPVIRYRRAPGSYVDQRFVPGVETQETFYASVQPASAKDLQMLPEGERFQDVYNLITYTDLQTASQYTGTNADQIGYRGARYKVIKAPQWDSLTGHYQCLITRIQEGEGDSGVDP